MVSARYLLDSVIVIDHLNGHSVATEFLRGTMGSAAISVITRAEVLTGIDDQHRPTVIRFLELFPTLPIDVLTADRAALLRREWRWKMPDALQAALALVHDLLLATRNTRDFPPERHAFVHVPYTLPDAARGPR
jgi:predicted nucleic acid-binding protein